VHIGDTSSGIRGRRLWRNSIPATRKGDSTINAVGGV
jgi:hypothetical protein